MLVLGGYFVRACNVGTGKLETAGLSFFLKVFSPHDEICQDRSKSAVIAESSSLRLPKMVARFLLSVLHHDIVVLGETCFSFETEPRPPREEGRRQSDQATGCELDFSEFRYLSSIGI